MCVWGVVWCWGMLEQGFVPEHRCSQHCALCKRRSLAPAGRICSRLAASKPPGPAKLNYWPPRSMVPLPAFVRPLEQKALELIARAWGLMAKSSGKMVNLGVAEPGSSGA